MSKPDTYWPDGFCHGNELSEDTDLDQMIYPERREWPPPFVTFIAGETVQDMKARQVREDEAREMARYRRDRDFAITEGNVTGAHTGPPRTIGNGKED
jgi:hypothetical protein